MPDLDTCVFFHWVPIWINSEWYNPEVGHSNGHLYYDNNCERIMRSCQDQKFPANKLYIYIYI